MYYVQRVLIMLVVGVVFTLALLLTLQPIGHAAPLGATRYVAPNGNCGGATPCYATIQAALDAANPGDVIKVAQGVYRDIHHIPALDSSVLTATQVVAVQKSVILLGGFTTTNWLSPDPSAHPTIIDAEHRGRALLVIGDIRPVIEGFTMTRGDASGLGGQPAVVGAPLDVGGGVYVLTATVTLRANRILSNTAPLGGGGLYLAHTHAIVVDNAIISNTAGFIGGGMTMKYSDAILQGNDIQNNASNNIGGGIYLQNCTTARLLENRVIGNIAHRGGGMDFYLCNASIEKNIVAQNQALSRDGGGMYLYHSPVTLDSNIIRSNSAGNNAGGLYLSGAAATLVNNVIIDNRCKHVGSGVMVIWTQQPLSIKHTTIARNQGGDGSGLHITGVPGYVSTVYLTNTIISDHQVGITVTSGSQVTLNTTLWHDNQVMMGGSGTIHHNRDRYGDPRFAPDGYHLGPGSAAIDQGVDAGVLLDVDGQTRPQGSAFDIGADEYNAAAAFKMYLPLWRQRFREMRAALIP